MPGVPEHWLTVARSIIDSRSPVVASIRDALSACPRRTGCHHLEGAHMPDTVFLTDRIEVTRPIPASPAAIFDIVRSPAGHVAIDASGMLQDCTGEPAEKVGDTFVIHMDRESLNDVPLGKYDVTVHIITFERDERSRGTSGQISRSRTFMATDWIPAMTG